MTVFIEEILEDIEWRIGELATLKLIPLKYNFTELHKQLHLKYAVPAIYAIWEGFIKYSLSTYLKHLSSLEIKREEISLNLMTHYVDSICKLQNPRINFTSKKKVVENLNTLFVDKITLIPVISTETNINYKVLCNLLNRFCIDCVEAKYEKGLDRLLLFRNKIAHGENALIVESKDINEFVKLIEDLMLDLILIIKDCEMRKTYLRF